ncbi:MAG TPA: prolyl oligopeptidase family serine peptidase [Gemmataceae bacterium]|nr:prolyl oligopeptidase family serine peptidase [Gemmataceae bacterium]
MRRPLLASLVMTLLVVLPVRADGGKKDETRWTVDDVLFSESASDFRISPDCRYAVWVKTAQDRDKGARLSHLFRSALKESEEVQLTRGADSCTAPRWSPDGKRIAFLSSRPRPGTKSESSDDDDRRARRAAGKDKEPKTQIWLINPFGGEPWPLTEGKRDVLAHAWLDNDTLLFAAQEDPTLYEITVEEEKKDPSVVVEDEEREPPVRLFKVNAGDGKVTRLTTNRDRIKGFAVSPDGRWVVAVHERSLRYVYDHKDKPLVLLHDLKGGKQCRIFDGPRFHIDEVRWAPDGTGFYITNQHTTHPQFVHATVTELYWFDLAAGKPVKVDLDWDNGLAGPPVPTADGFLALLADGARNRAARYSRDGDGWRRDALAGKHATHLFDLALGKDGKTLLYNHSTASTPEQWYVCNLDDWQLGEPRQLTDLNPGYQKKTVARSEVISWKGAQDERVEGILYYPHNYQPGRKYPLVLMIHGGPASLDQDSWEETWAYPPNLICQRGAFVLKPNYHGSTNYGLKFAESIADGKYYDLPVADIDRGVQALIDRGLVDKDKLGTLGWSNGAILTSALLVQSKHAFKAAAAGAGGAEWVGDWGACEFGHSFDAFYFGKSPLEDPQRYLKLAPLYQFHKVTTPLILFHGTEDRAVPTHDSWAQYRALQQHGKAPVRFVLFPGEKHSLRKLAHQRRKLEEELAWFDRHLFGTARPAEDFVKADSPLAHALKRNAAKREGARFGVLAQGRLIPETVAHDGLEVGRFEVTRAQFVQFDPKYSFEPGTENYPANGITFEQAKAYCDWLSRTTGRTYRLPTEAEGESLYGSAGSTENTLDWWAGYEVNPDDAARLREKLGSLGGRAPLLREVGSFRAAGKEGVFDLGGNVAEWVVGKDGRGRAMGGSADQPADAKQGERRPGAEYVGFRVVREVATGKRR